jgi:preprotein translocase subunit SecA
VTIATNMAGRGTDIKLGAGVTDAAHDRLAGSTASTRPTGRNVPDPARWST